MATRYVSPVGGLWADNRSNVFGANRSGGRRLHAGNDLHAPAGSKAVAAVGGTVLYAGKNSGYGWNAVVLGDDGNAFRYATHGPLSVKVGQRIEQGQPIGTIAGMNGGLPHLHFEVIPATSPALAKMKASPGTFVPTSWWPGGKPVTVDPAAFFGVKRGTKVALGQPVGNAALRAIVPEKSPDPFGITKLQEAHIKEANVPLPRPRPETPVQVASSATLNAKDRSANIDTYNMGALGVEAPRLKTVESGETDATPVSARKPAMPAAEYAAFQQNLQSGKLPWSSLPETWRQELTSRLGERAEAAYGQATGTASTAIAAQPETPAAPATVAAAAVARGEPPPATAPRIAGGTPPPYADFSLPVSEPIETQFVRPTLAPAGMPPARPALDPAGMPARTILESRVKDDMEPAAPQQEVVGEPLDIRPPAGTAAPKAAPPAPRARPAIAAVPPALAARRAAPAFGGILRTLISALVPGASAFPGAKAIMNGADLPAGMTAGGAPLLNVKGPGPFSGGASAGSWLGSQSWRAPDFNPVSGGSRYSNFVDRSTGMGGYVTPSGQVYTYALD